MKKIAFMICLLAVSISAQTKPRNPIAPSGSWADGLIRAYLFTAADSVAADSVKDWSSQNVWGIIVATGSWPSGVDAAHTPAWRASGSFDYIDSGNLAGLGVDDSLSIFGVFDDVNSGANKYPLSLHDRNAVLSELPDKGFWFSDNDASSPYDWVFGVNTGSAVTVIADSIPNDASTAPFDNFFSILGIYDGANISVYRNGVLQASASATGTINTDANYSFDVGLGATSTTFDPWTDGIVSAVYLWNRVLSSAEIEALRDDPYVMFRGESGESGNVGEFWRRRANR